jgi:hypothetical protein
MGHHCQAQMWDGRNPLCLRCADGEPCYAVTAEALETPERMKDEVAEERWLRYSGPTRYEPRRIEIKLPYIGGEERAEIKRQLCVQSLDTVARAHGIEPCMIAGFKPETEARKLARLEQNRLHHEQCKDRDKRRRLQRQGNIRKPVDMTIAGERVRMAPGATMGAEMIGCGLSCATVIERVAAYFGVTVDELKEVGKGHSTKGRRRMVAVVVVKRKSGLEYSAIAKIFGMETKNLLQSLRRMNVRLKFRGEVRRICTLI